MTQYKFVRIKPDDHRRIKLLGKAMVPRMTITEIVIEMVRERLPKWEKGYARRNGK